MHSEALWQIAFPAPNSELNISSTHMYQSATVPGIFTGVQPSQKVTCVYNGKGEVVPLSSCAIKKKPYV